jgi:LTXXQ motif family protein
MFEIRNSAAHAIAAAALLAAATLAAPASAQTTPGTTTAAPATPPSATAPAKPSRVDRVEAHIAQLHQELKITPEQQPQWDALAQAMRDNAHQMQGLLQDRAKNVKTASAVDDLKSYEALADAHADGLKKFVPAFEALYASMSDDQKKTADTVFREHQPHRRSATKKS